MFNEAEQLRAKQLLLAAKPRLGIAIEKSKNQTFRGVRIVGVAPGGFVLFA